MTDSRHRPLSGRQAAERVGVSPSTIRMWVKRDTLVPTLVLNGAHYFTERAVLEAEKRNRTGRNKGGKRRRAA